MSSAQLGFRRVDVRTEIVEPKGLVGSPSFARELLSLHRKEEAKERIRQFLEKKNAGTITMAVVWLALRLRRAW
jgi:hypothetical protein